MSKFEKLVQQILRGSSDKNIDFDDLCKLLKKLGFEERIKGSHHIFTKDGVEEIINIQTLSHNKAKAYQVKQVRELITTYQLSETQEKQNESGDEHI